MELTLLDGDRTTTVPVGPEGVVSLQLAGGMGHVTVDVTGYALAAVPVVPPVDPALPVDAAPVPLG